MKLRDHLVAHHRYLRENSSSHAVPLRPEWMDLECDGYHKVVIPHRMWPPGSRGANVVFLVEVDIRDGILRSRMPYDIAAWSVGLGWFVDDLRDEVYLFGTHEQWCEPAPQLVTP